jgi:hypothetical protein
MKAAAMDLNPLDSWLVFDVTAAIVELPTNNIDLFPALVAVVLASIISRSWPAASSRRPSE